MTTRFVSNTLRSFFGLERNIQLICLAFGISSLVSPGQFYPLYLQSIGVAVTAIGLVKMVENLSRTLSRIPGGFLTDRYGRKIGIVSTTFVTALCEFGFVGVRALWQVYLVTIPSNLAIGFRMPAYSALISESVPPERRGAAYGTTSTFIMVLAGIIGSVLTAYVVYAYGFAGMWFFTGLTTLIGGLIALNLTETMIEKPTSYERKHGCQWGEFTKFVKSTPTLLPLILASCLSAFASSSVDLLKPLFAVDIVGLTYLELGFISSLSATAYTLFQIPSGKISDRYGRKPLLVLSGAIVPMSLLAFLYCSNFYQMAFVLVMASIAQSVSSPPLSALLADITPRSLRSQIIGWFGTLIALASLPAPIVGGVLWDCYGNKAPFYLGVALTCSALLTLIFAVKEPTRREE